MPTMLVTCPETAHLEQIEYDDHPFGMLVLACSRFEPACVLRCDRACAARLDRKRLLEEDADTLVQIRIPA